MRILSILVLSFQAINAKAEISPADINSVIELRQNVEALSFEIENNKKKNQAVMDTYIQREQELSTQLLKEKFKTNQLKAQIEASKNKIFLNQKSSQVKKDTLWLAEFWGKYQSSLQKANPVFAKKLSERLEKIKLDYKDKRLSYEHALLQTWHLIDEDLKKSQDTEYHLAPFFIGGKNYQAEMVRLGRTTGYFRTAQGQYGRIAYDGKWDVAFFEKSEQNSMVETLLKQFKQQQKTGLYNLPGIKP